MPNMTALYGRWEPAPPTELVQVFSKMPCPWWVADGYAIELAAVLPFLASQQRRWLGRALARTFGGDIWRDRLSRAEFTDRE